MERNEVSLHEVLVFKAIEASGGRWLTNKEIATSVSGQVSDRTVRAHTLKLVSLGLVEQAEVFPAHRFRLATKADKRNKGYWQRLNHAAGVFGLDAEAG